MSSGHNGMFWKYVVVDWLALAVLQWNELEKHHLKKTESIPSYSSRKSALLVSS